MKSVAPSVAPANPALKRASRRRTKTSTIIACGCQACGPVSWDMGDMGKREGCRARELDAIEGNEEACACVTCRRDSVALLLKLRCPCVGVVLS